jgi:formamidopyrimidine-DNA glycosylase
VPELPEVETVRQGLDALTRGYEIEGGEVLLERTLAYPFCVSDFLAAIAGQTFQGWQRRGKYLLAALASGDFLGIHLRMTGQLFWGEFPAPLPRHTRVRLFCSGGQELRFVDTRTFGRVWLVPRDRALAEIITGLQRLGPEPWSADFSYDYFAARLRKTQRTIKATLLDQALVAGLGNIYADEVLFTARVRPDRVAAQLKPAQVEALYQAIPTVLESAIAKGGTTFSDFLSLLGVPGNYGDAAWVYGRTGEPCKICATPIERLKITGRSSHFCPVCQP